MRYSTGRIPPGKMIHPLMLIYNRFDAFLTISTCSKELAHSGTNRMVVMAKRLEVGEEYLQYVENASMRDNQLLPEKLRN